ncbi:MAG: endo-1,4-beta-xylanase [Asticcacaulis sp.]
MHRRGFVAGAVGLAAVAPGLASAQTPPLPPLKSAARYPLGVCVSQLQLDDPQWVALATGNFSRLTPEWEMKMEYVLQKDGSLQFDRADRMMAFARAHGMAMHGHCLVWYAEDGEYFQRLKGNAFLNAYVDYIQRVMRHFNGVIRTWDVVNEPITDDGAAIRDCLWRQRLGEDYVGLALTAAHEADPSAALLINEYNLEFTPKKRATLLKLCERVMKDGAPLHGIGTQTHITGEVPPGAIRTAIRDIASLGLKIHVSEVDISLREARPHNAVEPRIDQVRVLNELVGAYNDVPAAQRLGMTFWGVRDSDSWLNRNHERTLIPDEPLLFDRLGRPKPLARELVKALRG